MTAPRMTDEECVLLLNDLATSTMADDDMDDVRAEMLRARSSESALLARVERLEGALGKLLRYAEHQTCTHEETHRGGVIWTICNGCGKQWADDRGGFVPYRDPPEFTEAAAALSEKP